MQSAGDAAHPPRPPVRGANACPKNAPNQVGGRLPSTMSTASSRRSTATCLLAILRSQAAPSRLSDRNLGSFLWRPWLLADPEARHQIRYFSDNAGSLGPDVATEAQIQNQPGLCFVKLVHV